MINSLSVGGYIVATRTINPTMITFWKYAKECASISGGMTPGTKLKIVEISKIPGQMWVKVEIPGRSPIAYLKISGEEYSHNFQNS
jgi:hypothetical protein